MCNILFSMPSSFLIVIRPPSPLHFDANRFWITSGIQPFLRALRHVQHLQEIFRDMCILPLQRFRRTEGRLTVSQRKENKLGTCQGVLGGVSGGVPGGLCLETCLGTCLGRVRGRACGRVRDVPLSGRGTHYPRVVTHGMHLGRSWDTPVSGPVAHHPRVGTH